MDPYVGEIRLFAGDYAPRDWALCNGAILSVQHYTALFSIIGNMYGGDGKTTFALPNLSGKAPMGQGTGSGLTPRAIAASVGKVTETLLVDQMPSHSHAPSASNATSGGVSDPTNMIWGGKASVPSSNRSYSPNATVMMNASALDLTGGDGAHNNMQPFLALNFIIALDGVYPSKN